VVREQRAYPKIGILEPIINIFPLLQNRIKKNMCTNVDRNTLEHQISRYTKRYTNIIGLKCSLKL